MNYNDLTIATITLARTSKEEDELIQSLQQLASLNIPVVVADGGSSPSFINFLQSIAHFTLVPQNGGGLWGQAKASVLAAQQKGTPFIFYTEPDKKDFFEKSLPQLLQLINPNDSTGIITASRTEAGFSTFPLFQQMTENTINNCCAEVITKKTDYCYGPFLLNSRLAPYLQLVTGDIGWGWRPYMFAMANRLGYSVEAVIDDYRCPVQQQSDTTKERLYRMKQLEQNIKGLVLATSVAI